MNAKELYEQILKKKSFLCVGLDSDLVKIPQHLKEKENPILEFNKKIIDATAKYTVAYKPNIAFYECRGAKGWIELEETVKYIRENYPEIFIIADAKRGDIGNTAKMYAQAFFEQMNFDAVTLSPYMGKNSVEPFIDYPNKWAVLLGLTSNESAGDFQYFTNEKTGEKLFENVLRKSKTWASENQIMYVVGATKAEKLKEIREIIPNNFLLVPGVGAQGGSLEEVAKYGMNEQCGLLVNSSRGIIFADNSENFDKMAGEKAEEIQKQMAKFL